MPLHPTLPAPERILAFGPAGSGKTTNILNICKFAHITNSPARFWVIDTDFSMDRMLSGYPELPFAIYGDDTFNDANAKLTIYSVFEWREYEHALADIRRRGRRGDWVCCDFIGTAWSAVQEHYVNQVFHQDLADYFLQARKELGKGESSLGALEGWVDWSVINPLYRKWANALLYRGPWHLYCTAKSDNLSSDRKPTEDAQTRAMFARYQVKPVGQKDLPFQFHTVLLTGRRGDEERTITAIKDRERVEVSGLTVKNFTTDYLVDIAKWELT